MFKRKRTKGENRGEDEENRGTEEENRGNEKRPREDISTTIDRNRVYEEECSELLRQLLNLSSRESALTFELFQLSEEAKVETLRLAGLIANCKYYDKALAEELYKELDILFRKYLERK
jgi:predicted RNase H-like nuclease (RuvC/YqgF family)